MKVITETLEPFAAEYPPEALGDPAKLLFIDIETTGFTAHSSDLYLIGCAYRESGHFCTKQFFAEDPSEQAQIIEAFWDFASAYDTLVHYNGNQFDVPYLQQKCNMLELPDHTAEFTGIDLYRRVASVKHLLKLQNCKQRTLEFFLGIERKDVFTGGDLIGIYQDYVKDPTDIALDTLLLHNEDDLKGMLQILPMLSYYDLFEKGAVAKRVEAVTYKTKENETRKDLLITLEPPVALPVPFSARAAGCEVRYQDGELKLCIPITCGEMKYFYADYKSYYYLPEEDLALHKSVATFVDKEHRIQATAATCYTRKVSEYLPQWDYLFSPIFRVDYESREMFFELTEDFKRDKKGFSDYASHVLKVMRSKH